MESTNFLSGLGAAVAAPLKVNERVFEIRAVDRQACSLLETINQVNGQLEVARDLRKQKSELLSVTEKKLMDDTFSSTDREIGRVSDLVEKCRIALKSDTGNVAMRTRIMFVLRDSPSIQTTLQQLTIAGQSLNTLCLLLVSREADEHRKQTQAMLESQSQPPRYEEHNFLHERRSRNLLRRTSNSMRSVGQHTRGATSTSETIPEISEEELHKLEEKAAQDQILVDKDELFFEHRGSQDSAAGSPLAYLPYRAGQTSPSMTSLHSTTSAMSDPSRQQAYNALEGIADGFREMTLRRRGDSWHEHDRRSLGPVSQPNTQAGQCGLQNHQASQLYGGFQVPRRPVSGAPNLPLSNSSARSSQTTLAELRDSSTFERGPPPIFLLQTTEGTAPRPLFHKMVKVDPNDEKALLPEDLSNEKFSVAPSIPAESEMPEVVAVETSPEPIPVSSEAAGGMLTRARSKRYVKVESQSRRDAAVAAQSTVPTVPAVPPIPRPLRGPEHAPEVVMPSSSLDVSRPTTAHSRRDSDVTSIRSLAVPSAPAVGRARSRKWQEMMLERSEKLAKASVPD